MCDVPVTGFLTYGEIASYSGRIESWHNTTAVAVAIPAWRFAGRQNYGLCRVHLV